MDLFERFTDRSRKVMALAQMEAHRFNHEYLGTEHILLGLIKEGGGVGANALKNLDVDLRTVRHEVEKLIKSGPDRIPTGKLPHTPRAKNVVKYAVEEARNLNHNYVGTEHLLLGLLREEEGVAAVVLKNLNLELDVVRVEVLKLLGGGVESEEPPAGKQGQTSPDKTPGLPIRPRRLRLHPILRASLAGAYLSRRDFILPIFVRDGQNEKREIPSMPGIFQMSIDVALDWLASRADEGFGSYLVFGVIDRQRKDPTGSAALDPENVVCQLLRRAVARKIPMAAITDLCFCEYTSHGHCGLLSPDGSTVQNDATVEQLVKQALNHAAAGADVIAPSGMMDGAVGALRAGLDQAGFLDVGLMAYSVKYASAFYGPFRDAADSAPQSGDRRSYQMDPAGTAREAIREAKLDIQQGADWIMVKPAGPYLDILSAVKNAVDVPVVAYQVSGEYAMLEAAARNGWLDRDKAVMESLLGIRRAGADLIISYYGELLSKLLPN